MWHPRTVQFQHHACRVPVRLPVDLTQPRVLKAHVRSTLQSVLWLQAAVVPVGLPLVEGVVLLADTEVAVFLQVEALL